jgi:hypothetical protein
MVQDLEVDEHQEHQGESYKKRHQGAAQKRGRRKVQKASVPIILTTTEISYIFAHDNYMVVQVCAAAIAQQKTFYEKVRKKIQAPL